jgi:hypothetical protein
MVRSLLSCCALVGLLGLAAAPPPSAERGQAERGTLPPYYKKLGLNAGQVKDVRRIRADYRKRREDLLKEIDRLKQEEREALKKALTPEQRERLRKLREGKPGGTGQTPG